MIQGVQSATQDAVRSMQAGIVEVDKGSELTDRAGGSLNEIVDGSRRVMEMIRGISTSSEEQSVSAHEISQNIEGVMSVTNETTKGAEQSAAAAVDLSQQAENLRGIVEQFKL